jgi:hypothetical protein
VYASIESDVGGGDIFEEEVKFVPNVKWAEEVAL